MTRIAVLDDWQGVARSSADIITHMNGNICRCGTYHRIIAAIERASKEA